ncbi:MAG TPA: cytochrome c [Acetobacteraceae bacterium]|nr:cytochrome c [Acetobacteraceae bacterium]
MIGRLSSVHAAVAALAFFCLSLAPAMAADQEVARGHYLVTVMSCTDCHTPGNFRGHPDLGRFLGGSDVGLAVPGLGVFVAPNLTPDPATGLGQWTETEIVTALTTGVRPDGRILAPVMPWRSYAHLTQADAQAIAAYLKSLPPVRNDVAGPFGLKERPTVPVSVILSPDQYARLPDPGAPAPPESRQGSSHP